DRVNDPAAVRVFPPYPFLTDICFTELRRDDIAQGPLDLEIGLRHGGVVGFRIDRQIVGEKASHSDLIREIGQLNGSSQLLFVSRTHLYLHLRLCCGHAQEGRPGRWLSAESTTSRASRWSWARWSAPSR